MTSVTFVSFVVALALVEMHHSLARLHAHTKAPSRLPRWLRALLFRPQPYGSRGWWHYHSNQRKLMAMEAAEALEVHPAVVVVLAVAAAAAAGATWYLASALYRLVVDGRP